MLTFGGISKYTVPFASAAIASEYQARNILPSSLVRRGLDLYLLRSSGLIAFL
jgi:hypothetical protein